MGDIYGSEYYESSINDDWFASKGFIYCYFRKYHTLIINTHGQYRGNKEIKIKQLNQLNAFITNFQQETMVNDKRPKVILCGDFNCDMLNHQKIIQSKADHNALHLDKTKNTNHSDAN